MLNRNELKKYITKALIFISILVATNPANAEVKKYRATQYQREVRFIERVNYGNPLQTEYVGNLFNMGRITYRAVNDDPSVTFMPYRFRKGDTVLFNTDEIATYRIAEDKTKRGYQKDDPYFDNSPLNYVARQVVPCIVYPAISNEKKYGFCFYPLTEEVMEEQSTDEASTSDVLNYGKGDDFTFIYITLPKDRLSTGKIRIKHKGEWLEYEQPILGLSRDTLALKKNNRIDPNANTPQGIYRVEGVMKNEENLELGKEPYLDIDSGWVAVGGTPYPFDAPILSQIIDEKHWKDYWINEYALGQAVVGRNLLRIHGNSAEPSEPPQYEDKNTGKLYRPTQGCLNMGDIQQTLIDKLVEIGVISLKYDNTITFASGKKKYWNKTNHIGKVFVIVKDED